MNRKTQFTSSRRIPLFFDAQELGHSLREIAVDVIQIDHEQVISRWFHSNSDADLLIWTDGKRNVIKHQVSFLGQFVEWNALDGLKTGFIVEEETKRPSKNGQDGESREVIRFDQEPQDATVRLAERLVENVLDLSSDDRESLLRLMKRRQALSTTHASASPALDIRRLERSRPSFWRRLRHWFGR